ncbi:zinc ribbon domain-containing protein [Pyrobaculum islandicum]|uniref:zinc ribbon domain-containing protein n=1 Tax=Pyrobaculum islandicum TaxID=2277 RepID=UPI003CC8D30A
MPYVEERLYSTVCPRCGAKMAEERGRVMRCPTCGFGAHRDNAPMTWRRRGTGG